MKEIFDRRDLFTIPELSDSAVCVTTNGIRKNNGHAVMGAGIAKACAERFPDTPIVLGRLLAEKGNHVHDLGLHENGRTIMHVLSFPTKHHWHDNSDPELIRRSCMELVAECDRLGIQQCYLPKPGCNNGHLDYRSQVRPILQSVLADDRFIVVVREPV